MFPFPAFRLPFMLAVSCAISCLAAATPAFAQALELTSEGTKARLAALSPIQVALPMAPDYSPNAPVRFEGYRFSDVLKLMPARPEVAGGERSVLRFVADDGFAVEFSPDGLPLEKGVLAYRDLEAPAEAKWKSFQLGKSTTTPAPFFLVWDGIPYDSKTAPWPFQLARLEWVYPGASDKLLQPRAKDAAVLEGHALWKSSCSGCHSLNLRGGVVGAEFNVPKSITEYRTKATFVAFARAPSAFRARSRMPAQTLSDKELGAVWAYLTQMKKQKVCESEASCAKLD
jgi:mono/diheme cytochrome c family protein